MNVQTTVDTRRLRTICDMREAANPVIEAAYPVIEAAYPVIEAANRIQGSKL